MTSDFRSGYLFVDKNWFYKKDGLHYTFTFVKTPLCLFLFLYCKPQQIPL